MRIGSNIDLSTVRATFLSALETLFNPFNSQHSDILSACPKNVSKFADAPQYLTRCHICLSLFHTLQISKHLLKCIKLYAYALVT
jgi:hypothetical protein